MCLLVQYVCDKISLKKKYEISSSSYSNCDHKKNQSITAVSCFCRGYRGDFISRTGEGRVEILTGMLIISLRGVHQGFWSP